MIEKCEDEQHGVQYKVTLTHDCLTHIVRSELIESYRTCDYHDDEYSAKIKKHLRQVIKYYSDPDQWREFKVQHD